MTISLKWGNIYIVNNFYYKQMTKTEIYKVILTKDFEIADKMRIIIQEFQGTKEEVIQWCVDKHAEGYKFEIIEPRTNKSIIKCL